MQYQLIKNGELIIKALLIIITIICTFSAKTKKKEAKSEGVISLDEFKGIVLGMFSEETIDVNLIYDEKVITKYIKMMKVPDKMPLSDVDKYINYEKIKQAILDTVREEYVDADIDTISRKIDNVIKKLTEYSYDKERISTNTTAEYDLKVKSLLSNNTNINNSTNNTKFNNKTAKIDL